MNLLHISEKQLDNPADIHNLTIAVLKKIPGVDLSIAYLGAKKNIAQSSIETSTFFGIRQLKGLKKICYLPKLFYFCKKKQIQIVVTHRFKSTYLIALLSLLIPFKKKIAIFHGIGEFYRLRRKIFAYLFLRSFTLIAVSDAVKKDLNDCLYGFHSRQIKTIYNAIDFNMLQQQQLPQSVARDILGLPPSVIIFGQIGRLVPVKGQKILLRAFAKAQLHNTHLVIIGEGRERQALEKEIVDLSIQHTVHLLGAIPAAFRYIKALNYFFLSSLEEGFGMVLLEATAAQVPVIATRVGGVREIFNEKTALLVPENDVDSLSTAFQTVSSWSEKEYAVYVERQYKELKTRFDFPIFYEAWLQLLQEQ